ncbi:helix-turn-helix transcriptional regulator [Acidaminobacter sp. JC074]|uniref:helix-turn-helix domain-containing protein n=1 Tax=Acidaminobacter sp. JC074 TaxID=2530199 RepID=UPI001F0D933B|nr:helix-turn-helix transcriptional regulator [Acidaminobacter sp. JC074]MCH4886584.1 helix-turn-helix transcriptional regulator [Acidaminobacter sp. JC074]
MKLYNLKSFGNELRHIRESNHLTQSKVSGILGIGQDTLRRLENGKSIPKLETLDYLSLVYKTNIHMVLAKSRLTYSFVFKKDIDLLNEMIISKDYSRIDQAIDNINDIFNKEDLKPSYHMMIDKLSQFKKMAGLFAEFDLQKNDEDLLKDYYKAIIKTIQMSVSDFSLEKLNDCTYDYIEMRLLLLLCEISRQLNQLDDCIIILDALEENVSRFSNFTDEFDEILLKTYFHKAYIYHRLDDFEAILHYSDKGIEYSRKTKDYSIIHLFFFRKAAALHSLNNLVEADIYFKRCLNAIDLMGNEKLYQQFKGIIKTKYN